MAYGECRCCGGSEYPKSGQKKAENVERYRFAAGPVASLCESCYNRIDLALASSPEWCEFLRAGAVLSVTPSLDAASDYQMACLAVNAFTTKAIAESRP